MDAPFIIAHRGASAYAPENTLAAFDKAFGLGARFIEFDVTLSSDGEPFVIHDETLDRTTTGRGKVALTNSSVLASLDAGRFFSKAYTGEKIPHLKDVLKWLLLTDVKANLEIKPAFQNSEETVLAILSCLHQHWPKTKTLPLISSFDLKALTFVRSFAPEIPIGLLLDTWDEDWSKKANELSCSSIHVYRKLLTPERIEAIQKENYRIFAYTVNNKKEAEKLFAMGINAIFTDYPDLLS